MVVHVPNDNRLPARTRPRDRRRCRTVKINLMNQFGTTGVADSGVYGLAISRARKATHGLATPEGVPGTAGDEQLR